MPPGFGNFCDFFPWLFSDFYALSFVILDLEALD
jgi:hypothetical protein